MNSLWTPSRRGLLQVALAAGCAPALLRHADAATEPLFGLGIASGSPRADRVVLWTRLMGPALPATVAVRWELAEDEAFKTIVARGTERAEPGTAHSVHAEPTGLRPDRWYWYRFRALGQQSEVGRTRTSPAAGAATDRLRFAIASCQRYDSGEYAAWGDMARQDLDLVLFLGDYIYESATPHDSRAPRKHIGRTCHSLADYRQRYAQYKSDPQLQAMHARAPWILTWDDHEIANDWAGDVSQDLEPDFHDRRIAAAQAYWEHQPFPKAMRPDGAEMRLSTRYDWGRLARLITIDDRSWRDPQACPKPGRSGSNTVKLQDCDELRNPQRTLLGAPQEQWLRDSWDATRPWNLLGQQTMMARWNQQSASEGPGRYWTDGWDGYPFARERLLRDLAARRVPNAVVLGGDVHANFVADLKLDWDSDKAPIVASEFCGTSISSLGREQAHVDKERPWNPHVHYARSDQRGYMRFELTAGRLDAELRSVQSAWDANSPLFTAARFAVEAGRAGVQSA